MDEQASGYQEALPARAKIAYSLANGANGLLSGLGLNQLIFFYTVKLGFNTDYQILAWMIFIIVNALNDPLLGILEERVDTKIGRRVPVLRYGAPLYAVLFILVWFPFASSDNQILMFVNYLLMLCLFDTVYSMIGLVTYSLPAEMAITAKQRSSIMVYSTLIGFVPIVLGFLLPILFLEPDTRTVFEWQLLMVIIAIAGGLLLYFSSYFIKENAWARKEKTLGFIESIKETIKNKQFLVLEVSIFALLIVSTTITSGLLFLFKFVFITTSSLDYLYFGIPIGALIATIFLFNKYVPRLGVRKVFIIGSIIGAIGFAIIPLFGRHLSSLFIPITLIAVGFAAIIIGQQPLMADVIDYDEMLTGKRRETTYSGVNALITKAAISIANGVFLAILDAYGYDAELKDNQPATVADGVIMAFWIIPVVCVFFAVISLKYFKLDGPEWLAKKKALELEHQRKEKEYIDFLAREGKLPAEGTEREGT
ncbi:MAG: MFS transporter [Candidatus Lokiarchaeota archaeon]|nr:MFS transporter [Candidatus Lokiarchaeota archaeon]